MRHGIVVLALLLAVPVLAGATDVGDTRDFWGWDMNEMPPADRQFAATCRGVGTGGTVWVEDAVWGIDLTQGDVEAILAAWDDQTPERSLDPEQGIFPLVTSVYGDPPDVDGDPQVILLYYDVGTFGGYTFDGFFRGEYDEEPGATSNLAEVLHLNSAAQDPAGDYMLAVAAHEFAHMIIYNYDPAESGWLQESLGESAMIACGYFTDEPLIDGFADRPGISLIPDSSYEMDYGAALLMGTYLFERFGTAFLGDLVAEPASDVAGVDAVLADYGEGLTFADVFGEWTAANVADLPDQDDGRYGYNAFDTPVFRSTVLVPGEDNAFSVASWATQYFRFPVAAGEIYTVAAQSDDAADLRVHLIETSLDLAERFRVVPVPAADLEAGFDWTIGQDGAGLIAVAHAGYGGDAEGMLTATLTGQADDDSGDDTATDDDAGDDDASGGGDDDDNGGGCGC